jgi:hypothetical protein
MVVWNLVASSNKKIKFSSNFCKFSSNLVATFAKFSSTENKILVAATIAI